jgi:Phage protein Gp19/Gp15/Gp42.
MITVEDVLARLPADILPVTELERELEGERIAVLISDADELIREAFDRLGRDLDAETAAKKWLSTAVPRVIREMVSAAIVIGGNVNVASTSSTTGPQTDAITYRTEGVQEAVSFSGVRLTDVLRTQLGLPIHAVASGSFPDPIEWPEIEHRGRRR